MRKKILRYVKEYYKADGTIYLKNAELYEIYEFNIDNVKCLAYCIKQHEKYDKGTSSWIPDTNHQKGLTHKLIVNGDWNNVQSTLQIGRFEGRDGYYDIYSLELVQDFTEVNPAV